MIVNFNICDTIISSSIELAIIYIYLSPSMNIINSNDHTRDLGITMPGDCSFSLTCILCKILEHFINRHILDHLDEHKILVDAQHGFRRGSCETRLILTCHDLAKQSCETTAAKWTCLSWMLRKLLTPLLPTSYSSGNWKATASMATCTDGYSRILKEEPK